MDVILPLNFRTLGKRNKKSYSHLKENIEKNFLKIYSIIIKNGFERGFTREDISKMIEEKDFFHFPLYWNSLLLTQKIKLKLFSFVSNLIFPSKNFYYGMKQILTYYHESSSHFWNPGLIKNNLEVSKQDQLKLEFHIIPSPFGFKWDKPRSFFLSLRNYLHPLYHHKIGHAFIVIKKNNTTVLATGMTGETNYQVIFNLLFSKGGLEFLFQSFRGRLEKSNVVLADIAKHKLKGKLQTLSYDISYQEFKECIKHIETWIMNGNYKNYGLPFCIPPSTGASCTSFAVSFLNIIGKLTEEQKESWKREVKIPKDLLKTQNNSVGAFKLFKELSLRKKWVNEEKFDQLHFWDPDLIYDWIKKNFVN